MREWATKHTDWSTKSRLIDQGTDYYTRDADWIFRQFDEDRGGVWCGGAAYALQQLYLKHGFAAWTYDSGIPGVVTHVVTVVQIQHRGRTLRVVQDATFNVGYAAATGEPLDITEMYRLVHAHKTADIRAVGNTVVRDMHVGAGEDPSTVDYIAPGALPVKLANGNAKYPARVSFGAFRKRYDAIIGPALASHGFPADPIYLFAFPLAFHPGGLALLANPTTP